MKKVKQLHLKYINRQYPYIYEYFPMDDYWPIYVHSYEPLTIEQLETRPMKIEKVMMAVTFICAVFAFFMHKYPAFFFSLYFTWFSYFGFHEQEKYLQRNKDILTLIPNDIEDIQYIKCPRCKRRFIHQIHDQECPVCHLVKDESFIIERKK